MHWLIKLDVGGIVTWDGEMAHVSPESHGSYATLLINLHWSQCRTLTITLLHYYTNALKWVKVSPESVSAISPNFLTSS